MRATTRRWFRRRIAAALEADVAVITGGMSVGVHDHVNDALASLGVTRRFAGVALKPGKPVSFGTRGATLVFGLPGNPVSSLVTFLLFARPALQALAGESPSARERWRPSRRTASARPSACRPCGAGSRFDDDGWHATTTGPQSSHILTSLLGADALAIIPAGEGVIGAGSQVARRALVGEPVSRRSPTWCGGAARSRDRRCGA